MVIHVRACLPYFALMGVFLHNNSKINKDFPCMNLHEYQAKQLFGAHGIPVPARKAGKRESADRNALPHRTRTVSRLSRGPNTRARGGDGLNRGWYGYRGGGREDAGKDPESIRRTRSRSAILSVPRTGIRTRSCRQTGKRLHPDPAPALQG